MDIRESKSMLAKLLATENIKVEHGNYETAAFDPKKRVLYLPIFKWMDGDVYDLLVLHEVSHALNTPADGWHSSASSKGKGYKSFLNVTEDARIEKKIKRKYPGASKAMVLGYRELMKNDFFGISHVNVDKLPLIDRINLHTKGGASMGISFTEDEMKWVDELMSLETFPEIVEFTDRLYDYCAENESMTDEHDFNMFSSEGYGEDDEEFEPGMTGETPFEWTEDSDESMSQSGMPQSSDENEGSESDNSDGPSAETDESSKGSEETNSSSGSSSDENPEGDKEESDGQVNPSNTVGAEGGVNTDNNPNAVAGPRSITDEFFRRKETELNDSIDSDKKYIYANLPKPVLENIVIDYKKLAQLHDKYYNQELNSGYWGTMTPSESWSTAPKRYKEFREQNKSIVDYLAKEFEMKKRADEYKRTASANTGVLETSKLYSYKYSDNLFKRVATVTSGKNHGLVMFIDWSGSMSGNMAGTVEQMMILVMFCKKVNIPFDVYAFTDRIWRFNNELNSFDSADEKPKWDYQPGDFCEQEHFNLMQLFSSNMSNIEFNKACWNAINIRDYYNGKVNWHYNGGKSPSIPSQYSLGGTPLNAAIVASHDLVRKFKRDHNVQIVNTVFLTDGDSNQAGCYLDSEGKEQHIGRNDELTIRDIPSKSEVSRSKTMGWSASHRATTETLFNSLRKATGANIIGFFLVNRLDRYKASHYSIDNNSFESIMDSWRKEKCIVAEIDGYDNLYIIKDGSDLQIEERSELDKIDAGSKKSAIRTAFKKMNRKKLRNRVVLNKFIEQVA